MEREEISSRNVGRKPYKEMREEITNKEKILGLHSTLDKNMIPT